MIRWFVVYGIILILAALLWPTLNRLGLGQLPGDFVIDREGFRFYVMLSSSFLVSLVVTLVLWLIQR